MPASALRAASWAAEAGQVKTMWRREGVSSLLRVGQNWEEKSAIIVIIIIINTTGIVITIVAIQSQSDSRGDEIGCRNKHKE